MKQVRRIAALMTALAILLCCLPALAETFWVHTDDGQPLSIRDENTNQVIGQIPEGTAVTPDPERSTDVSAYVTYEGQSGFVLWRYLTRTDPGAGEAQTSPTKAPSQTPEQPSGGEVPGEGEFLISVTGATVTLDREQAGGAAVRVSAEDVAWITADVPEGGEVACWVFNGVPYEFSENVTAIRVEKADRSWAIEAVPAGSEPQTQLTAEAIQAARTGEDLVARGVRAELSHIDAAGNPGGMWRSAMTFTRDYQNMRTQRREDGGQISLKVRAHVLWNEIVLGWKFDETEFYPDAVVPNFLVRHLNTPMTYEPITGTDTDMELPKVTVRCINCVFTGGGYTDAAYGEVPVGTTIEVRGLGTTGTWEVNGSMLTVSEGWYYESSNISRYITQNTVIHFYQTIN